MSEQENTGMDAQANEGHEQTRDEHAAHADAPNQSAAEHEQMSENPPQETPAMDATPVREAREERGSRASREEREDRDEEREQTRSGASEVAKSQMIINYVPGEECRVAIVEDGNLEELHAERFAAASRVGNIYVGRVNNVEPNIQAAFVDFGVGENGFLHVSDLHPRYFPGEDEETTERVGHKTPRRERPPIQAALRRGDEVIVQVIKEGVGTKGPTITSYLSIPGRFLVMMPQMDKVGVSRKVEDEDLRKKMREILDQLELPEGFGFILRTAGMDRTKLELKRDLAYLMRLYKDMEKRRASGDKPRLLYSESDLLVRALRDQLTADIHEVVIDNDLALQRAARFMKIVAPRSNTKLVHYSGKTPIFHAFGIEPQIAMMNAREVPLPSGGRLVIDQTEALVAIDVNSGKSRDSRDAETNAYRTNVEAVDAILRQLRLRDLGGIIINDLIDMRSPQHRKDIENRFKDRLKRDRARTTVLQISEFGILQMTRQRMRGSHEQVHFADCPTCRGRGLVQRPDSVAAEAIRELAALLDHDRVSKVELVVSARVAGELLSTKRQLLSRAERASGKHVDVRVSETLPPDRVAFYAYDSMGADIDLNNLPQPRRPKNLTVYEDFSAGSDEVWASDAEQERRANVDPEPVDQAEQELAELASHPIEVDVSDEDLDQQIRGDLAEASGMAGEQGNEDGGGRRKRRRRGGRGRGRDDGGRDGRGQQQHGNRGHGQGGGQSGGQGGGRDANRGGQQRDGGRGPAAAPLAPAMPPRGAVTVPGPVGPVLMGDYDDEDAAGGAPASNPTTAGGTGEGTQPPTGVPMNGEGGEGGRRRRRRRRRGGRGRGGQGEGMNGGPGGEGQFSGTPGSGGDQGGSFDEASDAGGAPVAPQQSGYRNRYRDQSQAAGAAPAGESAEAHAHSSDEAAIQARLDGIDVAHPEAMQGNGEHDQDGPDGNGPDGNGADGNGGQGGEGGRRRRRRRRGGRGRGGQGGGQGVGGEPGAVGSPNAASNGPAAAPTNDGAGNGPREQREEGQGGRGGRGGARGGRGGRGGNRGGDRGGRPTQSGAPQSNVVPPKPAPAPEPKAAPGGPKPKLLYGNTRRRLTPAELNRRPKPE